MKCLFAAWCGLLLSSSLAMGQTCACSAPVIAAPAVSYYAPAVSTAYYGGPAAVSTAYYAPSVTAAYYAPSAAYSYYAPSVPVTSYYAASVPVTSYYAPVAYTAGYAVAPYVVAPRYYVPGQPIRNFFRGW